MKLIRENVELKAKFAGESFSICQNKKRKLIKSEKWRNKRWLRVINEILFEVF